jgi:hypothetical protein
MDDEEDEDEQAEWVSHGDWREEEDGFGCFFSLVLHAAGLPLVWPSAAVFKSRARLGLVETLLVGVTEVGNTPTLGELNGRPQQVGLCVLAACARQNESCVGCCLVRDAKVSLVD